MPFPFPEALQEFKVETSALPAQYGYHSAAVVNAVTKSGTNRTTGSIFEFLRDDALNATDPFSPVGPDGTRRSDGLNRNQFGGAIGGPIARDRLFYFAAYQRTRVRRVPTSNFQFVPTPAMLTGDFRAIASPQCNGGRQMALRAPFVDNRVDPALFSPASLKLVDLLGAVPDNPCGQVFFDRVDNSDEDVFTSKVDVTLSNSHAVFGRLQFNKFDSPTNYDGRTAMSFSTSASKNRVYSLALGDTKLFGNDIVNAFRVTINGGICRCPNSPEHSLNASVVYQIPEAGEGALLRAVTGGWQISGIVSARSGSYFTVTTGVDNALSGQPNQRANQVLPDPFMPNRSFTQWLNSAAFQAPAPGTYGTMPIDAIQGSGRWNVDMGVSRAVAIGTRQVQVRWEVFNLFNTVNADNPVATLNSPDFGRITALAGGTAPRIMQLAVKYQF